MRTALHGFIVTKDTCMAKGVARANPHLGKGGLHSISLKTWIK